MKIEDIQKEKTNGKPIISLSFRITKEHSKFLKEKNISPTKLFRSAVEELIKSNK